jgi:hypothetical protein
MGQRSSCCAQPAADEARQLVARKVGLSGASRCSLAFPGHFATTFSAFAPPDTPSLALQAHELSPVYSGKEVPSSSGAGTEISRPPSVEGEAGAFCTTSAAFAASQVLPAHQQGFPYQVRGRTATSRRTKRELQAPPEQHPQAGSLTRAGHA